MTSLFVSACCCCCCNRTGPTVSTLSQMWISWLTAARMINKFHYNGMSNCCCWCCLLRFHISPRARREGDVPPSVPHILHMHRTTRKGLSVAFPLFYRVHDAGLIVVTKTMDKMHESVKSHVTKNWGCMICSKVNGLGFVWWSWIQIWVTEKELIKMINEQQHNTIVLVMDAILVTMMLMQLVICILVELNANIWIQYCWW